jgi:hypothetical protein
MEGMKVHFQNVIGRKKFSTFKNGIFGKISIRGDFS